VRPSALYFDDAPPDINYLSAGTTAGGQQPKVLTCPKTINHSSCEQENCRVCWKGNQQVNYLAHGYEITQKIKRLRTNIAELTVNGKQA
jgi:hypothetical protein